MIYSIGDINYNVEFVSETLSNRTPVVFFHGFTGSAKDWRFIKEKLPQNFEPIFVDLLGHGKTDSPENVENYRFDSQIEQINQLFKKLKIHNPILVGYSMGGRLALSYRMKYPKNIQAVILESTSFGIEQKIEREERVKSDEDLADKISNSSIEEFINYWVNIPLFESQKRISEEELNQIFRNKVETNNKIGLQNSLLGFSSGKMKNFHPLLTNFNIPTLLVAGEIDNKYSKIANKVHKLIPNSDLEIIKDCGHNVHLEKTEEFLKLLNKFLLNIRDEK